MKGFSLEQKRALAQFLGSFAVAWLAGGVIAPYLSNVQTVSPGQTLAALFWAGVSLSVMLYLTGRRKK